MNMQAAEQLTSEEVQARQWAKFKLCLSKWHETNPFYRDKLRAAGVRPEDIASRGDLRRIPMVTKDELISDQLSEPPYGRRLGVTDEAVYRIALTGGTSGGEKIVQPMTEADAVIGGGLTGTAFRWAGATKDDIITFNVGISNHTGGWTFYSAARAVGRAPYIIGHEGFAGRIELMRRFGVNGMFATPSALNGLTVACHDLRTRPRDLFRDMKFLLVGAEAYPVEFAARMEDEWGARVHEDYGSTESHSAICASTCRRGAVVDGQRGMMHLYESSFLFEVIDPATGNHVEPGETGLFVITTIDKEASPILRYDTQDRVTWLPAEACTCGLPFGAIECGSIGRWDDMLKIKNTNIAPNQIDQIIFSVPGVAEYQGDVYIGSQGRDEATIRIAFDDDDSASPEVLARLSDRLREELEVRFEMVAVTRAELPTFGTAEKKARRWTDRRQEQLA
jgi:phenylacetate-CoA ligase